jgi:hypothetical protein
VRAHVDQETPQKQPKLSGLRPAKRANAAPLNTRKLGRLEPLPFPFPAAAAK